MAEPAVHQVTPRIGLLLAVHEPLPTTQAAIQSLLNQQYPEFSLTVVADGVSDEFWEQLQALNHPKLQLIRQSFSGLIGALNHALASSKPANFYAVVYAHCTYNSQYLMCLMNALLAQPGAGGAYTEMCRLTCLHEPPYQYTDLLSRNVLGYTNLFRLETLKRIGGQFLEHPLGIWQTWREMAMHKPFVLAPKTLLPMIRVYEASPYERQPREQALPAENKPLLRLKILAIEEPDATLKYNLKQEGHLLMLQGQALHQPDVLLLTSPDQLADHQITAQQLQVPVVWLLNDPLKLGELLKDQPWWFLVATVLTQDEQVYQQLKQIGFRVIRYPGSLSEQFLKIPLLLNRFRVTIVVRSVLANPAFLEGTLNSLEKMAQPGFFGDVIILRLENFERVTKWLAARGLKGYQAPDARYFIYLAELLEQTQASFVLQIDAGVMVAETWFYRIYPFLWAPRVAMASSYLHHSEVPEQHIPLAFKTLAELQKIWPDYYHRLSTPGAIVPRVSDSLVLIKKHILEFALRRNPFVLPLDEIDIFSRIFWGQMNLPVVMSNTTYGFHTI